MTQELLPCPFCGHKEPYFERTGNHRHSCIVACGDCGCYHESADEDENSGKSWNRRDISKEQIKAGISAYEEATGERLPDADGKDAEIMAAILKAVINYNKD